jgi:hypothetical protein
MTEIGADTSPHYESLSNTQILLEIKKLYEEPTLDVSRFIELSRIIQAKGIEKDSPQHKYLKKGSTRPQIDIFFLKRINDLRQNDLKTPRNNRMYKEAIRKELSLAKYLDLDQPLIIEGVDVRATTADYIKAKEQIYGSSSSTEKSKSIRSRLKKRLTRRDVVKGAGALGVMGILASAYRGIRIGKEIAQPVEHLAEHLLLSPKKDPLPVEPLKLDKTETKFPIPTPTPIPKVEVTPLPIVKPLALGELVYPVTIPTIYDAQTGRRLTFDEVERIKKLNNFGVVGYGSLYPDTFRCYDPGTNKFFDIPINQLLIKEGSPVKEMPRSPYLGIRCNDKELIKELKDLGVSKVRIVCNNDDPTEETKIQDTMKEASRLGLNILCTYNPSFTPSPDHIRAHFQEMLRVPNITLEIGNEPDETTHGYWEDYNKKGGSFESFAKFVKTSINIARSIKPDVKIIIGALAKPEHKLNFNGPNNQERFVAELKRQGVDITKVDFSVHAYHDSEIRERVPLVQKATGKQNLVMTELGHNTEAQDTLPGFIQHSKSLGVGDIYIHEFPIHEDSWGFINPKNKQKLPKYFFIQKMVLDQSNTHKTNRAQQ